MYFGVTMDRYAKFLDRLQAGACLLIDGGTGTECERRGIPQLDNAWNGGGALSHPDIVRTIHSDYLNAGAEIIISNTFATTLHALRDAGEDERFDDYNRQGVVLACEARDASDRPEALVAGGISYWSWTHELPTLQDLANSVERQARIMAQAGADLVMLEMMIDIDRMLTTLKAAQTAGLPVWVGVSCAPNDSGVMALWNGEPLEDALKALNGQNVPLVSIMHTDTAYVDECLEIVNAHWSRLVGVYAHSGKKSQEGEWLFHDTIEPARFTAHCQRWRDQGAAIIGGCCGIRPEHIVDLSEHLQSEG